MNNIMDMPTPCKECNEIFDLEDGRAGLTHRTIDYTICESCYNKQSIEKDRVDKIRTLLENKEDRESQIEEYKDSIEKLKDELDYSTQELEISNLELDTLNYDGDLDDYHNVIDEYY